MLTAVGWLQMKRVGVGGGLVPFFKCVCVYFLAASGAPSAGAAAAKCAPVLCLLAAVLLLQPGPPQPADPDPDHDKERRRYARRIALGLALSALGDALLVWEQHFAAGMAAFALAHVAYMSAFRARAARRRAGLLLYAGAAAYCAAVTPPPALAVPVPLYAALLVSMAWRALRTLPENTCARSYAAPAGALLFVLSDALLGYSLFGGPLPYRRVLVMSTYYLGQLGLALSALLPPPLPLSTQ
ncbi:lysoplasmalogenase TMEM86A isoform X1 [Cydia splendana]|uniref:lysoplasmalogenase TMEM86A isoform X1 n=1 Tax=Cydia splendana TaxID=1100963 RepID=UPI00300C17BE